MTTRATLEALPPEGRTAIALLSLRDALRYDLVEVVLLRHAASADDASKRGREIADAIAEALRAFGATTTTDRGGREILGLPAETRAALQAEAEETFAIAWAPGPPTRIGVGRRLLAFALTPGLLAQRAPRLTADRSLHATDAKRLAQLVPEIERLYAAWTWVAGVKERDGVAATDLETCRRVLEGPPRRWAPIVFGASPYDELSVDLAELASEADPGARIDLAAAVAALAARGRFTSALVVAVEYLLPRASLVELDLEHDALSIPADLRSALRGEPIASPDEAKSWVQPNFEIVLGAGVPLVDACLVGCMAETLAIDAVARLRITEASVRAARALGLDAQAMIDTLVRVAGGRELPAPVRNAITEWAGGFARARLRDVVLLEIEGDPKLVDRAVKRVAPLVVRRPAPGVLLLSRAPSTKELSDVRAFGVEVLGTAKLKPSKADLQPELEPEPEPEPDHPRERRRSPHHFHRSEQLRDFDLRDLLVRARVQSIADRTRPRRAEPSAIPGTVDDALRSLQSRWAHRPDWLRALERLEDGEIFRAVAASDPAALAAAIDRAGTPGLLELAVGALHARR